MQTANGERQTGNQDGQTPNAGKEPELAVRGTAEEAQQDADADRGQRPPPELAAGGTSLEDHILLPETEECLGEGTVVIRLVQRHGCCGSGSGVLVVCGWHLTVSVGVRSGLAVGRSRAGSGELRSRIRRVRVGGGLTIGGSCTGRCAGCGRIGSGLPVCGLAVGRLCGGRSVELPIIWLCGGRSRCAVLRRAGILLGRGTVGRGHLRQRHVVGIGH